MRSKQNLHDWVFHFNIYTDKWGAATRDNYQSLFSDRKHGVLESSNINTLVELIERTNGDTLKIEKLVKTSEKY